MAIDHVARGLDTLPSQFFDSPLLRELITIYLEELQEIEDCLEDILLQMNIDEAIGVQLDRLGEHLGRKREGLNDTEYRKILKIQRILNAGEGQYKTVLQMWRTLLESDTATLTEEFPAGVSLYSDVGVPTLDTLNTLTKALPVTVTLALTSSFSADPAFCFFGGDGEGFGTTEDPLIGGELIGRYTNII